MIGTGSMTDPYIPLEEELCRTRGALELIWRYGFGATVITKSARILRDIELLQKINERAKCVVQMTLTTCDETLCRKIEPNVSTTAERLKALKEFRDAGIPTVVWLTPILPFINDTRENISGILDMCIEAQVYGIICFGMGVTLRDGSREYFYRQLDRLFPGMKERYIRAYGSRYELPSPQNAGLMELFLDTCGRSGIVCGNERIFWFLSEFPEADGQYRLPF